MNKNIAKLYNLANKKRRKIIGLMSGTSLDGLDLGLFEITDAGLKTIVNSIQFDTINYPNEIKEKIREVFAKKSIDFQHLTLLNAYLGNYHGDLINQFLDKYKIPASEVDLIASHGQTVFHAPKTQHKIAEYPNATLQIADGDHIAVKTGIITISDFRQKHIAAGGEGAPLAVYGDYFIFSDKTENRIMLNIGGIANFTYLPNSAKSHDVYVTDTGPGNTLIDAFVQKYFPEKSYDKDANMALMGKVNFELLNELGNNFFFSEPFPKTTGPEMFNISYVETAQLQSNTTNISIFDLLATITLFTAQTIAIAIRNASDINLTYTIYLSGGGMHNPLIISHLKDLLPNYILKNSNEIGINGDAKEALLFAILANETVAGGDVDFGSNPAIPSVSFGKISFPN